MKHGVIVLLSICVLGFGGMTVVQESASSHDQAVLDLLRLMGLERTLMGAATAMVDAQITANPAIAPYRDVMLEWISKYFTWDAMVPDLSKIYKETFTESELRELIAFYQTPTGQKSLAKIPELMQKGAAVGVTLAQQHTAELEVMLQERKKQIEAGKQTP